MSFLSLRSAPRADKRRRSTPAAARWLFVVGPVVAVLMVGSAIAVSSFFPWGRAHPNVKFALLVSYTVVVAIFCVGQAIIERRS